MFLTSNLASHKINLKIDYFQKINFYNFGSFLILFIAHKIVNLIGLFVLLDYTSKWIIRKNFI